MLFLPATADACPGVPGALVDDVAARGVVGCFTVLVVRFIFDAVGVRWMAREGGVEDLVFTGVCWLLLIP